jgi:hypothetical protein
VALPYSGTALGARPGPLGAAKQSPNGRISIKLLNMPRTKLTPVPELSAEDGAHALEEMGRITAEKAEHQRRKADARVPARRIELPTTDADAADSAYVERLRRSMRGAINFARRRQALRASPVVVDVTLEELMEILRRQYYRCAISGLPFWCGSTVSYGPTIPSLDRIRASEGNTRSNIRVVLLGVNGLRGSGSNEDMLLIAQAVVKNGPKR